jgi:hypothetical protein
MIIGRGGFYNAIGAIRALGLETNLQLCLDAGDNASAPSGATSWLDTSGNGHDFFRGAAGTGEATDPTQNGTPGALTSAEYWSFDGGDFFTYDTTNETWMQNLHKDNAAYSAAMWVFAPSALGATNNDLIATRQPSATGWQMDIPGTTGRLQLFVGNGAGSVCNPATTATVNANAWNFVACSLDESVGANGCVLQINDTQELKTSTYTSPSSGDAAGTMKIGGSVAPGNMLVSGFRIASLSMWSRALSAAELTNYLNATRDRYGI